MVSVVFTGDIAFSGHYKNKYNDFNIINDNIVKFLNNSDYVVANIEAPITSNAINSSRIVNHCMSPQCLPLLHQMNINIWNLANNHILDCGEEGLYDTLNYAKKEKVYCVGANINKKEASKTLIIGEDVKIGIISLIDDWNWLKATNNKSGCICCTDLETIKMQINELKNKKVNHIIAVVHNGYEFCALPMNEIREKMHRLLELGVNIIVGHHPHVVQNYEKINDKIIFYSLGNFIFDTDLQRVQKNTDKGILLKINFQKDIYNFEYINTIINRKNGEILTNQTNNPIFTNIDNKENFLLQPLSMKYFFNADKTIKRYLYPNRNKTTAFKEYIKRYMHKSTLKQEVYRYLYYLQYWRFSKEKEVINYIKKS